MLAASGQTLATVTAGREYIDQISPGIFTFSLEASRVRGSEGERGRHENKVDTGGGRHADLGGAPPKLRELEPETRNQTANWKPSFLQEPFLSHGFHF